MSSKLSRVVQTIAITSILISNAACTTIEYVPVPPVALPMPARPVLPAISADALTCLSQETYTDLVTRDAMRRAYEIELEAIIRSTQEAPE